MMSRIVLALALTAAAVPDPAHIKKVEEWRAKHESDYRRDWVTVAGLHFLKPGPNTVGSAKSNDIVVSNVPPALGRFVLNGQQVRFEPLAGVKVMVKDRPVTTAIDLKDDGRPEADELLVGSVRLVIHLSGDKRSLRVRDPNGELARGFAGFKWFPIDEKYRVVGRFIKDAQPSTRQVVNTLGDLDTYTTDGVIEFTLLGKKMTVRPFTTRPKRFYIVFKDESSGKETYDTARFLYSDLSDDGTTVLDFNEAYNPPCSFNPYTTCPIPLKENRLPVKILAGERAYPNPPTHSIP
jgi:uncharacterized protein (DUF1684 family)